MIKTFLLIDIFSLQRQDDKGVGHPEGRAQTGTRAHYSDYR